MNPWKYFCIYLAFISAAFGASDITVHETNSIRLEIIPPERRPYFTIEDQLVLRLDNALFPSNTVFLPSEQEVFVEVTCVSADGRMVPRKGKYRRMGNRFNDVSSPISRKSVNYKINSFTPVIFRSGSHNFLTRAVHGRSASRDIFVPSEAFQFPSGEEFALKLRFQIIVQTAQASQFDVIKFSNYKIHLRRQ